MAAVDTLIERLDAKPATAPDELTLTGDTIRDVVSFRLYSERTWPALVAGLAEALHGEYRYFAKVAPHVGAIIKRATATRVFEAYDAVLCNDFGTRRTGAEALELDRTSSAAYPRFFGKHFLAGELMRCAGWPKAQTPVIRDVGERLASRNPAHRQRFRSGDAFELDPQPGACTRRRIKHRALSRRRPWRYHPGTAVHRRPGGRLPREGIDAAARHQLRCAPDGIREH